MRNDNVKCTQSVLVKVQDLKKYFDVSPSLLTRVVERKPRALLKAVDGVSFEIRRGETLALVGESGCGKSTTARMLVGLDKPTAGTVEVDGKDLYASRGKDEKLVRGKIQMIFQDPYASLNPRWKVGRIVAEPIIAQKVIKDPKEIENRVNSVLHLVNLSKEDKDKYPHQFSGGQRQRISIARAIAIHPEFLVCDEPDQCTGCLRSGPGAEFDAEPAERGRLNLFVYFSQSFGCAPHQRSRRRDVFGAPG